MARVSPSTGTLLPSDPKFAINITCDVYSPSSYICTVEAGAEFHTTGEHFAMRGRDSAQYVDRWPYDGWDTEMANIKSTTNLLEIEVADLQRQFDSSLAAYHKQRLMNAMIALQRNRVAEEIQFMQLEHDEEARQLLTIEWSPRNPYFSSRKSKRDVIMERIPIWDNLSAIMAKLSIERI